MKTTLQIANEIGVTKQAVQQKVKKEPLATSLQGLSEIVGNTRQYSLVGENLIKSAFITSKETSLSSNSLVDSLADMTTQFIASLQRENANLTEQNADLREQLNAANEHSRAQAVKVAELADQAQRLQLAAMKQPQLTDGNADQPPPSKWREWFGRRKT